MINVARLIMNTRVPLVPQKDTRPEKKGAVVGVEEKEHNFAGTQTNTTQYNNFY